jgi:lysophosphatidate acyltransferase
VGIFEFLTFFLDGIHRVFPHKTTIMAKHELKWTPLGPFMALAGALFVNRGNSASAIKSLGDAGETMKRQGTSLWIFPEGTRSSSEVPSMRQFKKGGFHLAVQAGIPIIPIVTENYWRLYHSGLFSSGTLKVRGTKSPESEWLIANSSYVVLPPIPTTNIAVADVPSLAVRVHDQMLSTLREISVEVPPRLPEKDGFPSEPIPLAPIATDAPPTPTSDEPQPEPSPSASATQETGGDTSSEAGSMIRKSEGSENGTETEEDEGMVLVGHPDP